VSQFLQRSCPQNRELAKMVALTFGLHDHQGELWQTEADEALRLISPPLKDNSKTRQTLALAMENYSHASMCYMQVCEMLTRNSVILFSLI